MRKVQVRSCPLDEARLGALDLHDDVKERAGTPYNPYVIPVLSFPDMDEPDAAIENLAKRKGVYVVWGTENLLWDLEEIALGRSVPAALTTERIAAEVEAVTDGQILLDAPAAEGGRGEVESPTTLSLSVGGLELLQVRASEMRLEVRAAGGSGASRKGSGVRQP